MKLFLSTFLLIGLMGNNFVSADDSLGSWKEFVVLDNGEHVAASYLYTIKIYSLLTGKEVVMLRSHLPSGGHWDYDRRLISLSSDGSKLLSKFRGGAGANVEVFDIRDVVNKDDSIASNKYRNAMSIDSGYGVDAAWEKMTISPDGYKSVYQNTFSRTFEVRRVVSGPQQSAPRILCKKEREMNPDSVAFIDNDHVFYTDYSSFNIGPWGAHLSILDVKRCEATDFQGNFLKDFAFGKKIIVNWNKGESRHPNAGFTPVIIFDKNFKQRNIYKKVGGFKHLEINPNDRSFLTLGSENGDLKIWEVETGKNSEPRKIDSSPLKAAGFTPDGKFIVALTQLAPTKAVTFLVKTGKVLKEVLVEE